MGNFILTVLCSIAVLCLQVKCSRPVVVARHRGRPIAVIDCGSQTGSMQAVRISGCTTPPCPLIRGRNVTIEVDFIANEASQSCRAAVKGRIAGFNVPYPIHNTDGCTSNVQCPIAPKSSHTYRSQIFVNRLYPKLSLVVEWALKDDRSRDLFCFSVSAEIKDAM